MDLHFLTEFDTYTGSGRYEDALQEKDFVKRAIKLFDVREKLWKSSERSEDAINDAAEAKAESRARWPGRIAFAIVAPLCTFGVLGLFGFVTAASLAIAGAAALAAGLTAGYGVREMCKSGPLGDAEREIHAMEEKRKTMHASIETAIETMDSQLITQPAQVREEFRSAFNHASVKEEARLNRLHRAKVEEEVEEAREAAQTAATMSTIAAMNSATAAMNAGRR